MKVNKWLIFLIFPALLSCESHQENTESLSTKHNSKAIDLAGIKNGRWLALGDSDFDSYQADDLEYRVDTMASNAACVLSPIEVQVRDGRDFGEYAEWDDGRRHDYRGNFSLSGASIRNNIFGWRELFAEDARSGIIEFIRAIRDRLYGQESRLGDAFIAELRNLKAQKVSLVVPVVVQINIGINDLSDGSLYNQFSSMDSHYSWVDARTDAIRNVVDEVLDVYPDIIIILWQLLDDGGWDNRYSPEQERRITSHTKHWNENLRAIADARPTVLVFETNTLTRTWLGRKSDGTGKDIVVGGIRYMRNYVPSSTDSERLDNTKYVATRDGHGNTVLSALYTGEIYRLLNDRFGAGIPPFTPARINSITCQIINPTSEPPVLEIPPDVTIQYADLPYSIGNVVAYDSNGKNVSDSAVAVSDRGGALFGDGQGIQLRASRHHIGTHQITVTVQDANGLTTSKTMTVIIE